MKKVLITYAVNDERIDLSLPDCELIYVRTGIGKVKSTMRLMDAIHTHQPDVVVNIGTAGTLIHQIGDIFVCRTFFDRDYERLQIDEVEFKQETTPLLNQARIALDWFSITKQSHCSFLGYICNTGDDFVYNDTKFTGDIVDMEAYAQATVCNTKQIPFISVKYVTDVVGQNSPKAWMNKLADARVALTVFFENKKLFNP